jgi:hypothetical protein
MVLFSYFEMKTPGSGDAGRGDDKGVGRGFLA